MLSSSAVLTELCIKVAMLCAFVQTFVL